MSTSVSFLNLVKTELNAIIFMATTHVIVLKDMKDETVRRVSQSLSKVRDLPSPSSSVHKYAVKIFIINKKISKEYKYNKKV